MIDALEKCNPPCPPFSKGEMLKITNSSPLYKMRIPNSSFKEREFLLPLFEECGFLLPPLKKGGRGDYSN